MKVFTFGKLSLSLALIVFIVSLSFAGLYDTMRDQMYGAGEYKPLHQAVNQTYERHIENSRTEDPPTRKASEDKMPNLSNDLWDMELPVWPHFDLSPWNWDIDFAWYPDPYDGPYTVWTPEEAFDPEDPTGWYLHGCWIYCPSLIYCDDGPFECRIVTSQIVSAINLTGHVLNWWYGSGILSILPSPQALDHSRITISATTRPLS
ncbi:unnamed protein product, partial [marine sediment metagenome]